MKLVSLNLENGLHIDRHMQTLQGMQADVYCFQELVEPHIERYKQELGCEYHAFVPITIKHTPFVHNVPEDTPVPLGVGIISRIPLEATFVHRFAGLAENDIPLCGEDAEGHNDMKTYNWALLVTKLIKDGKEFTVGTLHFPKAQWSQHVTEYQHQCLERLLDQLKQHPDIIFCGDLNAPRGMEIYDTLAQHYRAAIPPEMKGTIDLNLHRNGRKDPEGLTVVIDGLFTTPHYEVSNLKLIDGVSDHMAIGAEVLRK
jgi:endonuclease/exonuclease/phosphatase family metal-dependent hydrolase